ncbi:hypothetical protein LAZ67_14002242 [Cordylochernes scorpioides]|uniref:DUF5641 domain-containing protein n=1 Tax=Cordylochernes scorpioides TaxID=51811 RepID=A0ABY6L9B4_9ARAC|nr:hypothetical protein LAZ67_14002242 [Cordylochernes scorpioides]
MHEPGRLGFINRAVEKISAKNYSQAEESRIENSIFNYANLPAGKQHANSAAACVADVTPTTSGAVDAAMNWAERMEALESGEDGFIVVRSKRRRRESPGRAVGQRSSGAVASGRTGAAPRRRPLTGRATMVQEVRATRADITDTRARQCSSSEEHSVFVEHCPDFEFFHYLQAVGELVGGAGNILQIMEMDGHMLVGLSTKALAEQLIKNGLQIGHTHLRAFPFKKRAERITLGNLPFFVDDAAVIEALRPYGDVTSIVPIRLRAGRCGRQGHRRANCPMNPARTINIGRSHPAPHPGVTPTAFQQPTRPTPAAPAPSPKRPAPQTPASATSAALPARTPLDAVVPPSVPMEIAVEMLALPTSNSAPQAMNPMEAPEASADPRPPASQPAGAVPQAQSASVAPPGPLHAQGILEPSSSPSSGRTTRGDLEGFLKRNPGVSFAEIEGLGLGREEVLDLLSSKTKVLKRRPPLTPVQRDAIAGLADRLLDLRPGGTTNISKVLRCLKSQILTFEELSTLTTQIEACLNSRPICPLSSDSDDFNPLTPGHLLIGRPLTAPPESNDDYDDDPINYLDRWSLNQKIKNVFWKRWNREYLNNLQQRLKWQKSSPNIKEGDLILLKDTISPPAMYWSLGRITKVFPGADGNV